MKAILLPAVLICSAALVGCAPKQLPPSDQGKGATTAVPARCTPAWNKAVNRRLHITDASGHGPDIGSAEWQNTVGRKSGVTDASGHGPDPGGDEWCRAVDYKVFGRR